MSNKIFLLNKDNQLISMDEHPYVSEDFLQTLLAKYPDLLGSDEIGHEPRKWLLISRETPVPDMDDASGRWSLDHLYLDQDGIPTLVEVKRSTDTRIRREVVGQMLDYAANAIVYWKLHEIRARFEARIDQKSQNPDDVLTEKLGIENVDSFWETVKLNLRAGKIRMLFVADEIPYELTRIIEFLNVQMSPAEVLGVEIKQFEGQGMRTLVPRLVGQTTEAQTTKGTARKANKWDEESFFAELMKRNPENVHVARKILRWSEQNTSEIWWGEGQVMGVFVPIKVIDGQRQTIFGVWTSGSGTLEFRFEYMRSLPIAQDIELRDEFRRRLRENVGIALPDESVKVRPNIDLSLLSDDETLEKFFDELSWFFDVIEQGGLN